MKTQVNGPRRRLNSYVTKQKEYFELLKDGKDKISEVEKDSARWGALLNFATKSVYVIKCENFYKIGWTAGSLNSRLDALQHANPFELSVQYVFADKEANFLERELHKLFAHKRIRREWFALEKDDFKILEDFILKRWQQLAKNELQNS